MAASGTARALPTRGERTTATTRQLEQPRTARRSAAGPVRTALTHVLTASRTRLGRRRALMLASAALAAVAIIAVLISIAGEGGGGGATTNRQAAPSPPPTDAPLTVQLDTLEHQARSATTR